MSRARAIRTTLSVAMLMLLSVAPIASSQEDSDLAAPPVAAAETATLTDAQLQSLVAPIALYPDPLIAQILPASTYPVQVALGARWLQANPNPAEALIDAQDVEPSIKALLHYPTVLAMMNDQLDWTQSLGVAFLNQQADVMNAIQELRQQALSAGTLQSTPQQQVVMDGDEIEILPVDPNLVYVPQYDPQLAYVGDGAAGVYLTFGQGYPEGLWLDNDVDWQNRWVAGGEGWHHGWSRPVDVRRVTKPWARNPAQVLPVRVPRPIPEEKRGVGPGYEESKVPAPAPGAFQGYQNRNDVQRAVNRVQQSRPAPPARPAPRPAPVQAFHAEGDGRTVAAQSARGNESKGGSGGGGGGGHRK
ncbi:MAG: DUF3300 domain-containing protein [Tepidisphaeraceae bacterium]